MGKGTDKVREGDIIEIYYENEWYRAEVMSVISVTGEGPLIDEDDTGNVEIIKFLKGPYEGRKGKMEPFLYIGTYGDLNGVRWRFPLERELLAAEEALIQFRRSISSLHEGMYGYDVDGTAEKITELLEETKDELISTMKEKGIKESFFIEAEEEGGESNVLSEVSG